MEKIPERLKGSISRITVEPPVTPKLQELCYDKLPWEYFEKLCLRLAQKEGSIEGCRQYGVKGDYQGGIDLYQKVPGYEGYKVYQCKNEKHFGPAKIKEAVDIFLAGNWAKRSTEFILCSRESLGAKKREDEIINQRSILATQKIDLLIWDSNFLNSKLKLQPEIVLEFFGLEWVKAFCGDIEYNKIRLRKEVSRNTYAIPENYISRKVHEPRDVFIFDKNDQSLITELQQNSRIALLGGAGVGKSVELKYLAYLAGTPEYSYYPFVVYLNTHTNKSIKDYIPSIEDIPEERLLILLDGLDEVQTGHFDSVTRKILEFTTDFPAANVVVSCRLSFFSAAIGNSALSTLNGFKACYLSDLDYDDIHVYLEKLIPLKKDSFLKEVYQKKLNKLITIPYYLLRLSQQYDEKNTISESKAAFFKDIIVENIKKDVKRYFGEVKLMKVQEMREALTKLAFILECQGKNHISTAELSKILKPSECTIVKFASSLLIGEEDKDSNWQFIHNNFQEYLAAEVLSTCDFQKVKEVISFYPTFRKVKPTWVNTISLIISITGHEEGLGMELVDWLAQSDPSVFFAFEPDRINPNLRFEILTRLLTLFKKQNRPINRMVYRHEDLANFTKSEKSLAFLTDSLESDPTHPVNSSILEILVFYEEMASFYPSLAPRVKKVLEALLLDYQVLPYQTLKAYIEVFDLESSDFKRIVKAFKDSEDTWVCYTLYYAIHKQGFQNDYVDLVIERARKSINGEDTSLDRLSNEDSELRNCLSKINSEEAFLKLLDFVIDEFSKISGSAYYQEVVKDTLINVAKEFPQNQKVYEQLRNILLNRRIYSFDKNFPFVLEYFITTNQVFKAFEDVYSRGFDDHDVIHKLALLVDFKCIEFVVAEFNLGKLQIDEMKRFQHFLDISNSAYLVKFNLLINLTEYLELPEYNYEKKREKKFRQRISAVFNKEEFLGALDQIFTDRGKDTLSYDEIWKTPGGAFDYEKYLPEVLDALRIFRKGQIAERSKLLNRVNKNWMHHSIEGIVDILKSHSDLKISYDQTEYVKQWCDEKIQGIDFTKALNYPDENTTRVNGLATKLCFLIRRLNFTHYPQEVYLDMVSFIKWDDHERGVIDFVETVVSKEDLDRRVITNIASGIEYHGVLEGHLAYCKKHGLKQVSDSLIPYMMSRDFQQHDILLTYFELGGENEEVELLLLKIQKDQFENYVVSQLIKRKSDKVLGYVLQRFREAKEDSLKLEYSVHLIELQNIEGLNYYIQYVKSHNVVPHDSHPANPLFRLNTLKALPYIFTLYEMSFNDKVRQGRFNNLRDIATTAWRNISLSVGNFKKSRILYRRHIICLRVRLFLGVLKINISKAKLIADMAFSFESMEQQYYVNKSTSIQGKEAASMYDNVYKSLKRE